MKKLVRTKILNLLLVSLLTFGLTSPVLVAQSAEGDSNASSDLSSSSTASSSISSDPNASQTAKRLEFLQRIKDELRIAQQNYASVNSSFRDTESKLNDVHGQGVTLSAQLQSLDEHIANTSSLIENVLIQITEKENLLKQLTEELAIKNLEMENQKKMLMEYLKVLYQQENSISNPSRNNDTVNILKLLLSDKPVGETLQEMKYFKILEANGHEIFDRLQNLANAQAASQAKVQDTRNKLNLLYDQLSQEKDNLEGERTAKNQLLTETQGQEVIYQQLLEEAKREQAQALQDIQSLRDNLIFIQQKIDELGNKFNPDHFKNIFTKETTSVYDYIKSTSDQTDFQPRWPVSPNRGISAYFHDSTYPFKRSIGDHQAIDIPTPQGTPIHAPADGVVYKTRDNGYGYSYIILAHAGGFMTLFGHVSDIRVIEGQKITQGDIIGLSGAAPGTKGAGSFTTGPHLHFEVIKGGVHVDPLDYMPLSYLPLNSLPAKYLSRVTGEQAKVKRVAQ